MYRSPALHLVRYLWLLAALAVMPDMFGVGSEAQTLVITHCQGECPRHESQLTATRSTVVVHHLYAAGLNGDSGLADWAAYRLTKEAVGVASLIPRTWQPDPLVEFSPVDTFVELQEAELRLSEIATNSNNPYAGLAATPVEPEQRARLAPMTSYANTPYWPDLNNLSNMVPMPAPLRRGAWLQLEQRLNRILAAREELYVVTGPLFLISNLSLTPADSGLNPAAYFKVVSDSSGVAAFVLPGDLAQSRGFCDYRVNFREIEKMSGLVLFPGRDRLGESPRLMRDLGCAE